LASIATFPSDHNGSVTYRWTAAITHFYYVNSHPNYDKGIQPADLIHKLILDFQHKIKADDVKTHAAYPASTGYSANQQDFAPEKQTVEAKAEKIYESNIVSYTGTNSQEGQQTDASSTATTDTQNTSTETAKHKYRD